MPRVERLDRDSAARLLGVAADAEPSDVRRAFRLWAAVAHPDLGGSEEQFRLLCAARDVMLAPAPQSRLQASESVVVARRPWREVLRWPSPRQILAVVILAMVSVASVLLALVGPPLVGLAIAALAATAFSIAIGRALLQGPDHGHVIVTRTLAWLAVTALQCAIGALAGIPAFEFLPLLAVPFVASISLVNPGAGLWRARPSARH